MKYFCTYFDRRYLSRGLALYGSLRAHAGRFQLWVLCFDDDTHTILEELALPRLVPIRLSAFETQDDELLDAKERRSLVEYYFTSTASLIIYVLGQLPESEILTYLDADLFFYGPPDPLLDELGTDSVGVIGHRFPPDLRHLEVWGIYNVGWLSFRNDERAFAVLRTWRQQCLDWCFDRIEAGRFADQKYLDTWPEQYEGVSVLRHPGGGVAPWNLRGAAIGWNDGRPTANGSDIIFFHFHALRLLTRRIARLGLSAFRVRPNRPILRIYQPYIALLHALDREIKQHRSALARDSSLRAAQPWLTTILRAAPHLLTGELSISGPHPPRPALDVSAILSA